MNRAASRALLIAILLLAAGLRWWQPGLVEFKYDEAHTVGLALDVASGGPFPLTSGGTSVGIERPAGDAYLLALPLLLRHIEAAVWWLGALGIVAVALVYALGRRVGGPAVGLLASLYMAVNPWLVLYDRKLWSHIQVVFSVALLLLAWEVVVAGRRRAAFWFVVVAALQSLSHLLSLLQVLSWLSALLIAPRRWLNRPWLAGLGVSVVLLAPFVAGVIAGSAGADMGTSGSDAALAFRPAVNLGQALTLFGGSGVHALADLPPQGIDVAAAWFGWLVAGLILFGVVLSLRELRSGGRAGPTARLLAAWGALPLLVLVLSPAVYQQYWTVLLPLPALYFATGSAALLRRVPPAPRYAVATVALLLLLGGWTGGYASMLRSVEAGQGMDAFGIPLQRWNDAVQAAVEEARANDATGIRVAVDGVDPRYEAEPAVMAALLHGRDDVRLVAPGWPYFALVDTRYESESNVVATEAKRQAGAAPPGVTPGSSLLDDRGPSIFLWAAEVPAIEEIVARVGNPTWEGLLAEGKAPARVFVVPSRTEVARRAAEAARQLASGTGRGRIAIDEPDSPLLDALGGEETTVIPPRANDRASAEEAVRTLAEDGVGRVIFVEQTSGWWDAASAARGALDGAYRLVGSWPEQVWTLHVYALPPEQLRPADIAFGDGLRLDAFAIDDERVPPGGMVIVHADWSAQTPLPPDLKVSYQLLGPDGIVKSQVDRDLAEADVAAGALSYGLRLPAGIPDGAYRLVAVIYDGKTGQRIPSATSDLAELGQIFVSGQALP